MENMFTIESDLEAIKEVLERCVKSYYFSERLFKTASLIDHAYGHMIRMGRKLFIENIGFPRVNNLSKQIEKRYDLDQYKARYLIKLVKEYARSIGITGFSEGTYESTLDHLEDFEVLGLIRGAQENFWKDLARKVGYLEIKSDTLIDYFENAVIENKFFGVDKAKFCRASAVFYLPMIISAELYA